MRHRVYNVRYCVVRINSSLLTIPLYSSVITTLVYSDTIAVELGYNVMKRTEYFVSL